MKLFVLYAVFYMLCLLNFINTTSRGENPSILCIPFRFRIFGEQFGNNHAPYKISRHLPQMDLLNSINLVHQSCV